MAELPNIKEYIKKRSRQTVWRRVLLCMAAVVVFCTSYALILPAVAMEQIQTVLDCPLSVHQHTESCYDSERSLICGKADYVTHTHNNNCYDIQGNLVCELPEIQTHIHNAGCFWEENVLVCQEEENPGHIHDQSCYEKQRGDLLCQESTEAHTHGQGCYDGEGNLICEKLTEAHQHADECYAWNDVLICGKEEGEGSHTHSDGCFEICRTVICGKPELHVHTDGCWGGSCDKLELLEHVHGAGCFREVTQKAAETATETEKENEFCAEEFGTEISTEEAAGEQNAAISEPGIDTEAAEEQPGPFSTEEPEIEISTEVTEEEPETEIDTEMTEEGFVEGDIRETENEIEICVEKSETEDVYKTEADEAEDPIFYADNIPIVTANDELIRLFEYARETDGADIAISIRSSQTGEVVEQNPDGTYDIIAGDTYVVRVTFTSVNKLEPGRYYVRFQADRDLTDQSDSLILKSNDNQEVNVGRWYFSEQADQENWLIFDVNEDIEQFTNITLMADVMFQFDSERDGLDFDGIISVNVKPNNKNKKTEVSKWARDRNKIENAQPNKIYWETEIMGNEDSHITGSTLSDTIVNTDTHYYTQEDMDNGIEITAYKYPNGDYKQEPTETHRWTIRPGAPGLTWTASGWTYTMPETVTCERHGNETHTVGNDDWIYYLKYTSTVKDDGANGYVAYENTVKIDGSEDTGKALPDTGENKAEIVKHGSYNTEAQTAAWDFTVTIPGARAGKKYDYFWYLWDEMKIKSSNDETLGVAHNDLDKPISVTAKIGDHSINVPELSEATEADDFCWECEWSSDDNHIIYGRQISLYSRCKCTAETCPYWKNDCGDKKDKGFCRCWSLDEDVEITFTYQTDTDKFKELIETYGGQGAKLRNNVSINNKVVVDIDTGKCEGVWIASSEERVPIPGVFTKQKTDEPDADNGYLAGYTITVNENMSDLSQGRDEVIIEDTMSNTLVFMSDTLIVTAADAQVNRTLALDKDYTVVYDHDFLCSRFHPGNCCCCAFDYQKANEC